MSRQPAASLCIAAFLLSLLTILTLTPTSTHALKLDTSALTTDSAPVPEGFSLPNIFNPVLDRADGRDQAKSLVNLVAKEPKVAYGVGNGAEKPIEDMWNGEADPESSASVAQLKMLKEVDSLTKLIEQGKKILKVLPRKQKRLALLKSKLSTILNAKAKREAGEKIEEQQALLDAIKKREGAMSTRLSALKKSQKKLTDSVGKLQKVIDGPKKGGKKNAAKKGAKGKKGAAAGKKTDKKKTDAKNKKNGKNKKDDKKKKLGKDGKPLPADKQTDAAAAAGAASAPKSFLETGFDSDSDSDSDNDADSEFESEADAEVDLDLDSEADADADADAEADSESDSESDSDSEGELDSELQFEAAEAYDQE